MLLKEKMPLNKQHLSKQLISDMQNDVNELFKQGLAYFQQGELIKANSIFNRVLKKNSKHFDALHLSGVIAAQLKNPILAVTFFAKAIEVNHEFAGAYYNIAIVLHELKRFSEALSNYDRAIEIKPDFATAYLNRGNTLQELNRHQDALASYDRALEMKSDYTDAYFNRGNSLRELKRFEEAILSYEIAIQIKPDYADAYTNKGNALKDLNRLNEAIKIYDLAIEINPAYAEAYYNRGIALRELKRFKEALANYDRAIDIKPNYSEAYYNRGIVLQELKQLDESLASYDCAIEINPDFANAYWNKSLVLLLMGQLELGWKLYEWRWKAKDLGLSYLASSKPKTVNIDSIYEKKLLVFSEQGIGDQILYAGLLDQLFINAPLSQIMLDKRLLPLMNRSMSHAVFLSNDTPIENIEHDEHLPIGDLGKYFRNNLEDFNSVKNHYLIANQQKTGEFRSSLLNNKKFLCGIAWESKREKIGIDKSIQLKDLSPILSLDNIAFVSLQYGNVKEELISFNNRHNFNIQEFDLVDNFKDLDGHASLIDACDFVITISNTSAHLSGALGKETYLLCPSGEGLLWYWSHQLNGKSLWYPSINIHKQTSSNQWVDVVNEIKKVIEKKINDIT